VVRRWSRSAAMATRLLYELALLSVDEQFYPDGVKSWMVKIDTNPKGGIKLDEKFFVELTGCAHTRYGWKAATHRRLLLLLGHA